MFLKMPKTRVLTMNEAATFLQTPFLNITHVFATDFIGKTCFRKSLSK